MRSAFLSLGLGLAAGACGSEANAPREAPDESASLNGEFRYQSDTPPVTSENGMVVSTDVYASDIGVEVMRAGGNAVDAAIAVSLALAVVNPEAGNIGGGGFMMVRMADGTTAASTTARRRRSPPPVTCSSTKRATSPTSRWWGT